MNTQKIAGDAWDACYNHLCEEANCGAKPDIHPNREQYLATLKPAVEEGVIKLMVKKRAELMTERHHIWQVNRVNKRREHEIGAILIVLERLEKDIHALTSTTH